MGRLESICDLDDLLVFARMRYRNAGTLDSIGRKTNRKFAERERLGIGTEEKELRATRDLLVPIKAGKAAIAPDFKLTRQVYDLRC